MEFYSVLVPEFYRKNFDKEISLNSQLTSSHPPLYFLLSLIELIMPTIGQTRGSISISDPSGHSSVTFPDAVTSAVAQADWFMAIKWLKGSTVNTTSRDWSISAAPSLFVWPWPQKKRRLRINNDSLHTVNVYLRLSRRNNKSLLCQLLGKLCIMQTLTECGCLYESCIIW